MAGEIDWGPRRDLLCEGTSEVNGAEMHTPGMVSAIPFGAKSHTSCDSWGRSS